MPKFKPYLYYLFFIDIISMVLALSCDTVRSSIFFLPLIAFGLFLSCALIVCTIWGSWNIRIAKRRYTIKGFGIACLVFLIWGYMFFGRISSKSYNNKQEDQIGKYLNSIRSNESHLTAFFSGMPKGGDLHHHYSGSVYAETYWNALVNANGYINTTTLQTSFSNGGIEWKSCSELASEKKLPGLKQRIFQQWSVKDYFPALEPSDKHFFDAFGKFNAMASASMNEGLLEIKDRAIKEHVSYIETMLSAVDTAIQVDNQNEYNQQLLSFNQTSDSLLLKKTFDNVLAEFNIVNLFSAAKNFCRRLNEKHQQLAIDDSAFLMRYLTYTNRTDKPINVFRKLLLAFDAANREPLIVGVNIVSPEDNEISMRDYKLHMEMFAFCHSIYPNVKYSMHAGELTIGLVQPENLMFHIKEAVLKAGASRIGHGVDIAYENDFLTTLKTMQQKKIAVEINLSSNEYILNVKDDRHPILLYQKKNVPIVISTDDAGILRTSLTHQFVLLAKRYPALDYRDIKSFIRNSINYSFIKEPETKQSLMIKLEHDFNVFEQSILKLQE